MLRSRLRFNLMLILLLVPACSVFAIGSKILPAPKKISEHVYAWIGPHGGPTKENQGYRMNMGFVVGGDTVAVLETGFYPRMAEEMVTHIRAITDKPIQYAINSNSQSDRFFGNEVFKKLGAKIIAHPLEIRRMEENTSNYMMFVESSMGFEEDSVKAPTLPDYPIDKATRIDLGGDIVIQIEFHKAAHTPSPLIVYIPSDNIVYAGDILYSGRLLAVVPGGDIKQWMETFNYMKKFENAIFIPGHGDPAELSTFYHPTYEYLQLLDQFMIQKVEEGMDMQQAIDSIDQSEFSYLENFEDLYGRNANRAYQEAELAAFD